ncbi:MAG: hypothetical protein FWE48_06525 [Coriobacteriia bacterium]|nr:hypothetical protein [Coriobacteriia bacterium]
MACTFLGDEVVEAQFVTRAQFTELEQSNKLRKEALESIQRLRINGVESSADWIKDEGSTLSATGFAVGRQLENQNEFRLVMIWLPEEIGGVIIYHALPFMVSRDTAFYRLASEKRPDHIDGSILVDTSIEPFPGSIYTPFSQEEQLVKVDFSIHEGWIKADRISLFGDLAYRCNETSRMMNIPSGYEQYRDAQRAVLDNVYWLDVSEGDTCELYGVVSSSPRYIRVPSRLGTATMYHFVRVYGLEDSDFRPLEEGYISVLLRENGLNFVERSDGE